MNLTERSLQRELLTAIIETARHLRHFIDGRAQQHRLTGAQLRVLSRLKRRQGMMQSELAVELEMRPISVGGMIDKLVGHGLVERRRDPIDRRINRLQLTEAGQEITQRLDDFREGIAREVLDGIEERAIEEALRTLHALKIRLVRENSVRPPASSSRHDGDEATVRRA